jgi:hypothetical protein
MNKWKCPYCEESGEDEWSKPCYYRLSRHLQENHLEEAFRDLVNRYTDIGKAQLIDNHWEVIGESIIRIEET